MNKYIILKRAISIQLPDWKEDNPAFTLRLKCLISIQVGGQYLTRNKQQLKAKSIIIGN